MLRATRTRRNATPEPGSDAAWLRRTLQQAGGSAGYDHAQVPADVRSGADSASKRDAPRLTSAALRTRAEALTRQAEAEQLRVHPVAVAPLFGGWYLFDQGSRADYVFCHLPDDPLFRDPDRFPIPQGILSELQQLERSGLGEAFDTLYVIHEVEKGSVSRSDRLKADQLVPPSRRVQGRSERMGRWGTGIWLGAAMPLLTGIGAAAATPAMLAAVPLGLDPVLLGAVVDPGQGIREGEIAVWFYLAHWHYTDEP